MWSGNVLFVVSLIFNFVGSDQLGRGLGDPPYHHHYYGPPPHNYHNNEGYPPPPANYHNHQPPPNFQFPPGFKHSPEFHERNNFGVRDGKKQGGFVDEEEHKNNSLKEIPLTYLEDLENIDVNELLNNYVDGYQESPKVAFGNRFGTDDDQVQQRNAGTIPAKAACIPENTSVSLASSDDPTVVFIPKCTRIERCGGCCSHKLLSCQPMETETVSVQVVKTQYVGAKKLRYLGKEVIPLEKHLKCKCSCKVKAEHCLPNQIYRSEECACACGNVDEERKCTRYPDTKYWDPQSCSCRCMDVIQCSTGSFYDHNECRCKKVTQRRYAKYNRRGYILEEVLVPLDRKEYVDQN